MISHSEVRQILVESLTFESGHSDGKRESRPLKARLAPIDEWIRITSDIGSHTFDDTWTGEEISKNLKKNQNVVYFHCGKHCHLKWDCS